MDPDKHCLSRKPQARKRRVSRELWAAARRHKVERVGSSLVLFKVSGVIFGLRVVPLQRQLRSLAAAGSSSAFDYSQYRALALRWEWWGAAALVAPFAGLALMVFKLVTQLVTD